MIYGSPPFQHIGGGPLPKMNAIANASHIIDFPTHAVPKPTPGRDEGAAAEWSIRVLPSAIDVMERCLKYRKEFRLTIPELLEHEFLKPRIDGEYFQRHGWNEN
jgi:serine/threonine-protein kinase TTK/MPS1